MEIKYIQMSSESMRKYSHNDDHYKINNGYLITKKQLNTTFRGISAGEDILINDNVANDYEIVYEDGTVEVGSW